MSHSFNFLAYVPETPKYAPERHVPGCSWQPGLCRNKLEAFGCPLTGEQLILGLFAQLTIWKQWE